MRDGDTLSVIVVAADGLITYTEWSTYNFC